MPKKDIDYLRGLSKQIDDLFLSNKDEAAKLLDKALTESKSIDNAYYLFFQGEYAGYIEKKFEKELPLLEEACKIKNNDYFLIRNCGNVLSIIGRSEDAIKLFNRALKIKPDDYDSLRQKGISLSKLGREDDAIKLFDQALAIKPDDYDSLRQKGVSLSKLDREEDAIKLFDQALAIKPDDYNSLRQKGVSVSELGREEEAIKLYNQALLIKPDDFDSIREKGVSLSNLGREKDAIKLYDQALATKPDDSYLKAFSGISFFKLKQFTKAIKLIDEALALDPKDKWIADTQRYIHKFVEKEKDGQANKKVLKEQGVPEIMAVVNRIRERMKPKVDSFLEKMDETEKRRTAFLSSSSLIKSDSTLFMILRKWNSFTPIIPDTKNERYVGGGYFLFNKGKGTVIDPGYNFIENYYNAGGRITDIHNIVITHAHNDHTNDFESLLSLMHQYNQKNKFEETDEGYKKVNIYFNTGAFMKFSGFIDLKSTKYIDKIFTMTEHQEYKLDEELKLIPLPAFHDESISEKYSLGLRFVIKRENETRNIVMTSDTGLYPHKKMGEDDVVDINKQEVWEKYELDKNEIHLLIPHIGSIKETELKTDISTERSKVFYANHLGIIGTIRLITALKPKLAVVSEFGEELKDFQEDLITIIKAVVEDLQKNNVKKTKVLPGDLSFIYNVWDETIYCVLSETMIDMTKINFSLPKPKEGKFYYYSMDKENKKDKLQSCADSFEKHRDDRKGLYFI